MTIEICKKCGFPILIDPTIPSESVCNCDDMTDPYDIDDSMCDASWEERAVRSVEIRDLEYQAHIDKIDAIAEKHTLFKDTDKI